MARCICRLPDLKPYYAGKPIKIIHSLLLIWINRLYRHGMSNQELNTATRGAWKVGEHRKRASSPLAPGRQPAPDALPRTSQGLSSGILEAGCKAVAGSRLKRLGTHWTVRGADAIIAQRGYKLPGRFEDFWERRARRAAV